MEIKRMNEIDKRIVEAAKEFVADYKPHSSTSEPMRKLYEAVEASKPKAARRIHLRDTGLYDDGNGRHIFTTAGSGYEMKPFIEATPEVETRCGPTAGVSKRDLEQFLRPTHVGMVMKIIADAQVPIEEKS